MFQRCTKPCFCRSSLDVFISMPSIDPALSNPAIEPRPPQNLPPKSRPPRKSSTSATPVTCKPFTCDPSAVKPNTASPPAISSCDLTASATWNSFPTSLFAPHTTLSYLHMDPYRCRGSQRGGRYPDRISFTRRVRRILRGRR